ncbi:MAG: MarC family protein [Deferribacteraceae bacterium]|jgi:multiple antibiotic resistance protein|nr:MarC family protein [Deferribacteraceae bacterium]
MEAIFAPLLSSVFALIAITNAFGNVPVFLSMSEDLDNRLRKKLFRAVILTAFIISMIFAVVGTFIMERIFLLTLAELRIAGGALIIAVAVKNLMEAAKTANSPTTTVQSTDSDIYKRIIPMAFPLLVGPGVLSTIIIMTGENGMITTILTVLISFTLIFLLFSNTNIIEKILGKLALYVISRIMQIFIMTTGVHMLTVGILDSFPILGGLK